MLSALLLPLALLVAPASAAPTERQWNYPDPSWPWYRVTCYTDPRCPTRGGAAYTFESNSTLTTACTQLPAGMHSCRLERFPVPGGVPASNACQLEIFWNHRNAQCANPVMQMDPLVYEWSWNCGSVWGGSIQGYAVDCSRPAPRGGVNRVAQGTVKGENAEAEYGAGGDE